MSFSCDTGRLWRDGQGRRGTGVAQHGHVATLCRIFMLLTRVFLALICRPPPPCPCCLRLGRNLLRFFGIREICAIFTI